MTIEVKDGKVLVSISDSFDAQELNKLIRSLCDALADLTGQKHPSGLPLHFAPTLPMDAFTSSDLALVMSIKHPTVGCVSTTVLPNSVGELLTILGSHIGKLAVAGQAQAAIAERQITGAPIQ